MQRSNNIIKNEKGVALILVTLSLVALAGLTVALLERSASEFQATERKKHDMVAFYLAEGGISQAITELNLNNDIGGNGLGVVTWNFGDQQFSTTAVDLGGGTSYRVTSTGTFNQTYRSAVESVVNQVPPPPTFVNALFGDDQVLLDSNAFTDSFDSDLGTYASQAVNGTAPDIFANENGDVGSNGGIASIGLNSNATVHGNAIPGPGGSVVTASNSTISGSTTPNTAVIPMPTVTLPSGHTSFPASHTTLPNYALGTGTYFTNAGSQTIPAGDYYFQRMEVNSNAILTIQGPATIVVDDLLFDFRDLGFF